jgi:hypothetical protein
VISARHICLQGQRRKTIKTTSQTAETKASHRFVVPGDQNFRPAFDEIYYSIKMDLKYVLNNFFALIEGLFEQKGAVDSANRDAASICRKRVQLLNCFPGLLIGSISTKAKPLDLPVARSRITVAILKEPFCSH